MSKLHDYVCPKCKRVTFDVPGNPSMVLCICGMPMEKQPSKVSVHFKNGGWSDEGYNKKK